MTPLPAEPAPHRGSPARLAGALRTALHLCYTGLLALGTWRAMAAGAPARLVALATGLLLGGYLVGAFAGSPLARRSRHAGRAWVAGLVLTWALACLVSEGYVWLAFPIFFLVLHLAARPWSWAVIAGVTAWSALAPTLRGDAVGAGAVIGPAIGAGAAVLADATYRQLRRDIAEQRRLLDELSRAQAELLAAERAHGVLQERERLARDIHDTLAQGFNAIVVLARAAAAAHPDAAPELDVIESTARDNLADARRLVRDAAGPGGRRDLAAVLQGLVDDMVAREQARGSGLRLELHAGPGLADLAPAVVETAQRAVQASLANVVEHADAARCVVSVERVGTQLCVDIVDDGRGFAPGAGRQDSFGLVALRQRAEAAGGTVVIDSTPGQGTSVALRLPLAPDPTLETTPGAGETPMRTTRP